MFLFFCTCGYKLKLVYISFFFSPKMSRVKYNTFSYLFLCACRYKFKMAYV
ncbi:hypothetical protein Hanom_Chr13g01231951 [Helianthus anomalus]